MRIKAADTTDRMESLDYLHGVVDSFPAALVSLDERLRIIMFNRVAEELTGFTGSGVVRRRISTIMSPRNIRYITRVLRKRETLPAGGFITKLRTKDAREVPVRLVVSPLRRPGEAFAGLLCIAFDLREVKRLQGKLLEAERLAALSEIATGLNHAINNPLCAILGNTQLLLLDREKLDAAAVRKLRSIEREIARIQKVAERLPRITRPAVSDYVAGKRMLDVESSEHVDRRPAGKRISQGRVRRQTRSRRPRSEPDLQ